MSDPDGNDDLTPGTPADETPPAIDESTARPSRRRDPGFRAGLLEKLPALEYTSWSAKEDFKIDEDWAGVVSLRSDDILGPLEPLAPRDRDNQAE